MASPMASPLEDDEATVETVDDGYYTEDPSTAAGKEASGGILITLLSVNPWYYIILAVSVWYLYQRYRDQIEGRLSQWRRERTEAAEAEEVRQNPELFRERMAKIEAQRRKMQEEYDTQAKVAAEKAAEREEERRKQKIDEWESMLSGASGGKGRRLNETEEEARAAEAANAARRPKSAFRRDYNPLMGDAGGSGYRPSGGRRPNNMRGG